MIPKNFGIFFTMLKKILFLAIFVSAYFTINAQTAAPVQWKTSIHKTGEKTFEFLLKATIANGWHIYEASAAMEIPELTLEFADSSIVSTNKIVEGNKENIPDKIFDDNKLFVYTDQLTVRQQLQFKTVPQNLQVELKYSAANDSIFIPDEVMLNIIVDSTAQQPVNRIKIKSIDLKNPVTSCGSESSVNITAEDTGLMKLFLLGFLGGLVALLTPCVFPMIPLTVSFFTKKATTRAKGVSNAFIYGFFIFLIYILLSLPFHFLDKLNPEILNNISTNVVLNIFFFVIFIVFAFSFFGYYEISLPARFSNTSDSKSGAGNIIGIFFMALTLALVSFSCTGPILGSLLAGSLSANGGAMQLTVGMGGFGLALALPFGLFALFPNWLNSIPKSGGWLTTVKVVLGFIELALAFKFLSNADLVMHWGILKREIFIGVWILCGILLTLYLFGFFSFKKEYQQKISIGRKFFGTVSLLFTLYLMPGITHTSYANLTLISGFPPPLDYSIYKQTPHSLTSRDYEEGLALAKKMNKPVLIDFTGYACVNCRRMEENVWSKNEVKELMRRFVVISLYVDDKKTFSADKQFLYKYADGNTKMIRTVGDKWSTFQTENFNNNSQPLYAIINNDEKLLNYPVGYTPSVKEYAAWLQCGLNANKKNNPFR